MGRRSKYESSFKAKVALAAVQGDKTLVELSKEYGVAPSMITLWKEELLKKASQVFEAEDKSKDKEREQLKKKEAVLLHKIGELTVAVDFFSKAYEEKVRKQS